MNWSEMQENWNELRALVQAHWPKLSGTVLDDIHADPAELGRSLQRTMDLAPLTRSLQFANLKRMCGGRAL